MFYLHTCIEMSVSDVLSITWTNVDCGTKCKYRIQGEVLKQGSSVGKLLRQQSRVIERARYATTNSSRGPGTSFRCPSRTAEAAATRGRKRRPARRGGRSSPRSSHRTRELPAAHNSRILNLSILDELLSRGWHLAGSQRLLAKRVRRGVVTAKRAGGGGGGEGGVPREIKIILSARPSLLRSSLPPSIPPRPCRPAIPGYSKVLPPCASFSLRDERGIPSTTPPLLVRRRPASSQRGGDLSLSSYLWTGTNF